MLVDVWRISLSATGLTGSEPESVLSVEERQRAARFRLPEHARRFRVCHGAVRLILGQYLEVPPENVELVSGSHGKPRLAGDSRLCFNLSHSGDLALLAVAEDWEVGVDVEAIRGDLPVEGLARFFTPGERQRLLAADSAPTRVATFFRWWTRKEAVLKAEGSGLPGGLDALDISACPPELARFPADGEKWWKVEDLDAGPGYAAAVAAPPGDWKVHWRGL